MKPQLRIVHMRLTMHSVESVFTVDKKKRERDRERETGRETLLNERQKAREESLRILLY